jgi:hypothetical protein
MSDLGFMSHDRKFEDVRRKQRWTTAYFAIALGCSVDIVEALRMIKYPICIWNPRKSTELYTDLDDFVRRIKPQGYLAILPTSADRLINVIPFTVANLTTMVVPNTSLMDKVFESEKLPKHTEFVYIFLNEH